MVLEIFAKDITKGPWQHGLRGDVPAPNLQRGPEIGPVRADFTRQECVPPPPPPRGSRPWVSPASGVADSSRGAPPRPVTISPGRLPAAQPATAPDPRWTLEGGAFPTGLPNRFLSRGGARGLRPGQSSLGRKREPPLLSRSGAQAPPGARPAGEGPSDAPRRLSTGAETTEGRGPDGRFPELLLRSCGSRLLPGTCAATTTSPARSPRFPRLLLPLLPPARGSPAPPRPGAPPACCASWRHAHRARRRRLWTRLFSSARSFRARAEGASLHPGGPDCGPHACQGLSLAEATSPRARRALVPVSPYPVLRGPESVSCKDRVHLLDRPAQGEKCRNVAALGEEMSFPRGRQHPVRLQPPS
ncbi:basic proline-rich protein-like [Trachypithecus francoisi]|uniref:basic proline-rich protein-like n=1 Tax=Trachypithecus francoisi TaxID=54180 RepID=UPI00141B8317|nr:basic proline-rich protein-like [Trachypithecus francoisi]